MYGAKHDRWVKVTEWPLTLASVVFIAAYALQVISRPAGPVGLIANAVIWVVWAAFLVDYVVRLTLAEHRGRWFVRHLLDLLIVLLPVFRPLRLTRFITVIALIQRGIGHVLRGKVIIITIVTVTLVILFAALAVLDVEEGPGNITNYGDALWWAFVTMTGVGYGDFEPVTAAGRMIAVGLMVTGIALTGVVTAILASWIVERVFVERRGGRAATVTQVEELRAEIAELKSLLSERD